jgi:hypothetical protein
VKNDPISDFGQLRPVLLPTAGPDLGRQTETFRFVCCAGVGVLNEGTLRLAILTAVIRLLSLFGLLEHRACRSII